MNLFFSKKIYLDFFPANSEIANSNMSFELIIFDKNKFEISNPANFLNIIICSSLFIDVVSNFL